MKWDFFYDEDGGKPYESINDWYKEIKSLIVATFVMILLGGAVYFYLKYFHF